MEWDSVTWDAFERALVDYRDREYRGPRSGEGWYLGVFTELAGVAMADRVAHVDSLVLFLNRWKCHFPRDESPAALAVWLTRESTALESLAALSILDSKAMERVEEFSRLHDSLIDLRRGNPRISTMSDACASKLLHQMVPPLFVMWDSKIKSGFGSYGEFMRRMHGFALRLRDELAPKEAGPTSRASSNVCSATPCASLSRSTSTSTTGRTASNIVDMTLLQKAQESESQNSASSSQCDSSQ